MAKITFEPFYNLPYLVTITLGGQFNSNWNHHYYLVGKKRNRSQPEVGSGLTLQNLALTQNAKDLNIRNSEE